MGAFYPSRRVSVHRRFYILVAVVILAGGFMLVQGMRLGTSMVLLPSELHARSKGEPLRRIRVAGRVTDPIEYTLDPSIQLQFGVYDPALKEAPDQQKVVKVRYAGLKPDMFAKGRDVIIDGEYANGVLEAQKLLTQCPSKYEAPDPTRRYSPAPDQPTTD